MPKTLLIVESPGKIKTLNKILGKSFIVKASIGHIRDLPRDNINIDINKKGFFPKYKISPDKKKVVSDLKFAAKKADKILLAPDPDREGEAIAWHLHHILKMQEGEQCRVVFNAITPTEVNNGVSNPSFIDINKVNAQQSRRMLDRLVGYKLSPFLWKKVIGGLSAGRVQSVAVLLVVEREKEIEAFVPEEYYVFKADFQGKEVFLKDTKLLKMNKKKADRLKINNEKAEEIKKEIQENKDNFSITEMKNKKKTVGSPQPFITSTLQQEASRVNGFTASQTMSIAQKLYEGKSIKGDNYGLITYMRTDSVRVSPEGNKMAEKYIVDKYGKEYYQSSSKRAKKSKGNVQDAHEAIRPTYVQNGFEPENIEKYLSPEEFRLYKLIWNRFIASQMKPAIYDVEDIKISDGKYIFGIKFEKLNFLGYQSVYKTEEDTIKDQEFVNIEKGEKTECKKVEFENKFTKPPARYTEASLIKTLEKEGIGRPSTYASIMKKIMDRNYVNREGKNLFPTDLGIIVNYMMISSFDKIINIKFTAEFESKLDSIEDGKSDYQEVLLDFYKSFSEILEKATEKVSKVNITTDIECPSCGGPMNLKISRRGDFFLACPKYPECKGTKSVPQGERLIPAAFTEAEVVKLQEKLKDFTPPKREGDGELELAGEKCEKCGGEMVFKHGRYGKFMACSNYPDCKNTKPVYETIGVKCPEKNCKGDIIERKSKRGKPYYTCSEYPSCKYLSFDKPVEETCPECGKNLYEKVSKKNGTSLVCQNKECPSKQKKKEDKTEEKKDK